jgi:hypothetical protein
MRIYLNYYCLNYTLFGDGYCKIRREGRQGDILETILTGNIALKNSTGICAV